MPNIPISLVPNTGQTLADTRDPIKNNFVTLNNVFAIDHVAYGILNEGKHNQVTLPTHTGPLPFIAGEIGLFNQTTVLTGVPDIWMQRGSGTPIPITGKLNGTNGWTYLPSGILLKWGTANAAGNSTTTTNFPVAANIPVFSSIFSMQITTNNGSNPTPNQLVTLGNYTTTNFVVFNRQLIGFSSAVNFTYLAIGV